MNVFNFFGKHDLTVQKRISSLPNADLLWISDTEDVPNISASRVSFKINIDALGNIEICKDDKTIFDASTIFTKLPIQVYTDKDEVDSLPYWPSYANMSPLQRYAYIMWLLDVTQESDMGNVFTYYYGLERHLLIGNFEKAFYEIIKLRTFHLNKSFLGYSQDALIFACLYRKKPEKLIELQSLAEIYGFNNAQFLIAYQNGFDLSPQNLIEIFRISIKLSHKPVKENYQLLLLCTCQTLKEQFGSVSFPFSKRFDIEKAPQRKQVAFVNYTFPDDLRFPNLHDFYAHKEFNKEVQRLFELTYELYKKEKVLIRKNSRTTEKRLQ